MNASDFAAALLPGDILVVATSKFDWGDKAIRLANFYKRGNGNRQWGHAAVYMGGGEVIESFPGRGVIRRKLSEAYLTDNNYALLAMRREGLCEKNLQAFLDFFPRQVGDGFDMRALLYYPLYMVVPGCLQCLLDSPRVESLFHVTGRYYCSELVATGLQEAKDYCFERPPARVMPLDFNNPLILTPVSQYTPPGWKKSGWLNVLAGILYFIVCVALTALAFFIVPLIFLAAWVMMRGKKKER
jgi:hypothetical protein